MSKIEQLRLADVIGWQPSVVGRPRAVPRMAPASPPNWGRFTRRPVTLRIVPIEADL
jgi:hypothetical protein